MDTKAKKRVEVLQQRLPKLRQLLAAAKEQPDDPDEIVRLQKEVDSVQAEITKLKAS